MAVKNITDTVIESITPAKAKKLLENRAANRSIRQRQVEYLAREMVEGRFIDNGESIKLNTNGQVIDGQHRLSAIIETGRPMQLRVTYGLSPDAISTIDTGAKRTPGDALSINGFSDPNNRAAALTIINDYYRNGTLVSGNKLSPSATIDLALEYDTDRALAVGRRTKGIVPLSIAAALYYLASHAAAEKAEEFWEAVGSGEGLSAGSPALALRNRIVELKMRGQRFTKTDYLLNSLYCWNKFASDSYCKIVKPKAVRLTDALIGAAPRPVK